MHCIVLRHHEGCNAKLQHIVDRVGVDALRSSLIELLEPTDKTHSEVHKRLINPC